MLNSYLVRVVYEYEDEALVVITLYIARKDILEVEFVKIKYYPDSDILEIRILDEKPKYGEEYSGGIIIHYSEEKSVVKIEILDASKTILSFLRPILEQKPLKGVVKV